MTRTDSSVQRNFDLGKSCGRIQIGRNGFSLFHIGRYDLGYQAFVGVFGHKVNVS